MDSVGSSAKRRYPGRHFDDNDDDDDGYDEDDDDDDDKARKAPLSGHTL